jgi:hypothetical protein
LLEFDVAQDDRDSAYRVAALRGPRRKAQPGDQYCSRRSQDESAVAQLGLTLLTSSPVDFGKLVADETEKWAKVMRAADIKVE